MCQSNISSSLIPPSSPIGLPNETAAQIAAIGLARSLRDSRPELLGRSCSLSVTDESGDISAVSAKIEALLDEKIEGVSITAPIIEGDEARGRVDLSAIDFDKLARLFSNRP
jgi:hypothetical protein